MFIKIKEGEKKVCDTGKSCIDNQRCIGYKFASETLSNKSKERKIKYYIFIVHRLYIYKFSWILIKRLLHYSVNHS